MKRKLKKRNIFKSESNIMNRWWQRFMPSTISNCCLYDDSTYYEDGLTHFVSVPNYSYTSTGKRTEHSPYSLTPPKENCTLYSKNIEDKLKVFLYEEKVN